MKGILLGVIMTAMVIPLNIANATETYLSAEDVTGYIRAEVDYLRDYVRKRYPDKNEAKEKYLEMLTTKLNSYVYSDIVDSISVIAFNPDTAQVIFFSMDDLEYFVNIKAVR